ncbi:uncharacterized protein LOC129605506 isoform X2 [Condylostylus longicornis]|uniref:uncharacterized protein LOC129605506 isoform X2 n=1 Tax=Condylostylus longicornis TaxID=2530218 RepID=UPI00244E0089|nr:uncharacterized protein LOC129605506 isoform X2 [Condylostylus longicornis]
MFRIKIKEMLSTTTILIIVFTILTNQIKSTLAGPKGASIVDHLRAEYINLDTALWKYLNERQIDKKSQIRKVFDSHRQFIKENLSLISFKSDKYLLLNRYYEGQELQRDLIHLDGEFGYFKSLVYKSASNEDLIEERAILDFTEEILNDSVKKMFDNIDNIMNKQKLSYRIVLDARDQICVTNQSAQQFLYSLYSDVAYAELKGYTMMQFSWMMLRIYEKGNFTEESNLMRNEFIKRIDRTQDALRGVIKHADRSVWKCDPTKHLKGQTYDEVTRLLQGYIENEVDMNEDGTCRENCAYYQVSKSHGCYQDLYCAKQQRCTGKLYNCQYVDSDMWICPSALNSSRRYDYIEYENGRVLGEKSGSCVRGTSKVDSWWRWLFWHCSYCFCLCDEQGLKSDRYFNLRSTESDIHKNMVVTGLRFVKVKRIFHLQVQQGELLPRGNIKQESLEWKPVDDYQIFDRNVKSKVDYHTLAWENRAIDLDDINVVDPTHVITGIRFRVVGTHLNLEAKLSEYNFETGLLVEPEINSFWQSNDNTDVTGDKRTQVILRSPDIPIRSIARSQVKSKHNQYIEFTNTDMDKDAAQTTVPFIDIQEVTSSPPVPLSGVGIYYKGSGQYGGFIAPKLITYDFTPHIQSPFKAEERSRMI